MKSILLKLPGIAAVSEIRTKNNFIERISFSHESAGELVFKRLKASDAPSLFEFYFKGLSAEARDFFLPYPLFTPPVNSESELALRIKGWQKEKDWTFLLLVKDEKIIGVCLLKRWGTGHPVSGLAVHEKYRKLGLGFILQSIINEQARMLGLKEVWATVAPDNVASLKTHRKCGFKRTGKTVPHFGYKDGVKVFVRDDVELVKKFE